VAAAAEALTNAVKHGRARHVVVFADVDEASGGLFLSIKDDGAGFDPANVAEGVGLARSIRGRVEAAGGTVGIAAEAGEGAEVRVRLPPARGRRGRPARHGAVVATQPEGAVAVEPAVRRDDPGSAVAAQPEVRS
jgi:signal transduction histidine kinase